jgi:hypothetical protein
MRTMTRNRILERAQACARRNVASEPSLLQASDWLSAVALVIFITWLLLILGVLKADAAETNCTQGNCPIVTHSGQSRELGLPVQITPPVIPTIPELCLFASDVQRGVYRWRPCKKED